MHVEALNWSGMSTGEYASALLLSPWALRKWRARFDDGEVAIDWRAHLHPSARPRLSTSASDSAKESPVECLLTTGFDNSFYLSDGIDKPFFAKLLAAFARETGAGQLRRASVTRQSLLRTVAGHIHRRPCYPVADV